MNFHNGTNMTNITTLTHDLTIDYHPAEEDETAICTVVNKNGKVSTLFAFTSLLGPLIPELQRWIP